VVLRNLLRLLSGYYWDYSEFSEEAVALWSYEEAYEQGSIGQTASTQGAKEAAEDVLGVEIGGWPMEEVLGSTGEHTNPDTRRSLEIFWAILGYARANWQEVESEEAPEQAPRDMNRIYVTGRVVFGGRYHTSLEFVPQFAPPEIPIYETLSAYDDDDDWLDDGTLVAETNWAADLPFLMMTFAEVDRPGWSDFFYWPVLRQAHNHYINVPYAQKLPYDALPEYPLPAAAGADGYNSNGYIHGLLNATQGNAHFVPGMNPNVLPGWPTPVPSANFGL
jgi:hypothetical protein